MQKQGDTMAEVTYRPAHVKGEVRHSPKQKCRAPRIAFGGAVQNAVPCRAH